MYFSLSIYKSAKVRQSPPRPAKINKYIYIYIYIYIYVLHIVVYYTMLYDSISYYKVIRMASYLCIWCTC